MAEDTKQITGVEGKRGSIGTAGDPGPAANNPAGVFDAFSVVQSAKVLEVGEYDESDLDFDDDLDVLDSVLEADKFVFVFKRGDKTARLHCRRLAPSEIAMIESTLVSPRVLSEIVQDKELADEDISIMADDMADGTHEKMCKAIQMSILNKKVPALERIRNWDALVLEKIYQKVYPRGAETSVDRFPEVDSTSEE